MTECDDIRGYARRLLFVDTPTHAAKECFRDDARTDSEGKTGRERTL